MMARVVRSHYRYKRPPRKRVKTATIEGPVIVTISDKPLGLITALAAHIRPHRASAIRANRSTQNSTKPRP